MQHNKRLVICDITYDRRYYIHRQTTVELYCCICSSPQSIKARVVFVRRNQIVFGTV